MQEFSNLRVNASCTLELVQEIPKKKWEVTVTGLAPYDCTKVYTLAADTDNQAAQDGLCLFVLEMQKQHDPSLKDK
ncbi:MAG: hypothetical protein RL560_8 [Actinomycetota bacterium]|jgi:hypothetical protein